MKIQAASLRGLLLPFPTPFDNAGRVDTAALQATLKRWNTSGVNGYVALGSTGERVHLSADERRAVVRAAREVVPPEMIFLVGVGQHSTRATIAETHEAAHDGADALLVGAPHFYRSAMTQSVLAQHFRAVAEASPAPVVLYHIPQNTGIMLAPQSVAELSAHPNIIGIKDSSGDILNLSEIARLVNAEDFAVLTGHGGALYAALCTGACGAILAVGCVVPEFVLRLMQAVAEGQHEHAALLQQQLTPLAQAVTAHYGIGGVKAAMSLLGYASGTVRAPLTDADDAARAELSRLLQQIHATPRYVV